MPSLTKATISEYIHEPFMMFLAGLILYFLIIWKRGRNAGKWNGGGGPSFWKDQKDEIYVAFAAGLVFIVWDSQILAALDDFLDFTDTFFEKYNVDLRADDHARLTMKTYYYFLVAPAIEIIAWMIALIGNKIKRTMKKLSTES